MFNNSSAASFSRGEKTETKVDRVAIKDMMRPGGATQNKGARDFVTENAIAAILAAPRSKPKEEERNWLAAPTFAKRPAYLDRIKEQLAAEREYVLELADAQLKNSRAAAGSMREMSDEERHELLAQLKAKWTEVSQVRSAQPFAVAKFIPLRTTHSPSGILTLHGVFCPNSLQSLSILTPPPSSQLNTVTSCSVTACLLTRRLAQPTLPLVRYDSRKIARLLWTN